MAAARSTRLPGVPIRAKNTDRRKGRRHTLSLKGNREMESFQEQFGKGFCKGMTQEVDAINLGSMGSICACFDGHGTEEKNRFIVYLMVNRYEVPLLKNESGQPIALDVPVGYVHLGCEIGDRLAKEYVSNLLCRVIDLALFSSREHRPSPILLPVGKVYEDKNDFSTELPFHAMHSKAFFDADLYPRNPEGVETGSFFIYKNVPHFNKNTLVIDHPDLVGLYALGIKRSGLLIEIPCPKVDFKDKGRSIRIELPVDFKVGLTLKKAIL